MDITKARDVERYILKTALKYGFPLRQHETPTGNSDTDITVKMLGAFGSMNYAISNFGNELAYMDLYYPAKFHPEILFWTFEHELGHYFQFKAYRFEGLEERIRESLYEVEFEAWYLAEWHARNKLGVEMDDLAENYMEVCLASYEGR